MRWQQALDQTLARLLQQALEGLHLSARAYDRIFPSAADAAAWFPGGDGAPPSSRIVANMNDPNRY
jgi:hypothetical protein